MTSHRAGARFAGCLIAASLAGAAAPAAAEAVHYSPRTNFILRCVGCHGMDGSGSEKGGIPDYRNYVGAFSRDEEGRSYVLHVPGVVNSNLSNGEIAEVLNFIMHNFAGSSLPDDFRPFDKAEVDRLRAVPVKDVVALRRKIAARLAEDGIPTAGYPWP